LRWTSTFEFIMLQRRWTNLIIYIQDYWLVQWYELDQNFLNEKIKKTLLIY
jgi:hypothetical protein